MDINWDIFFQIHKGLPREGPGDNESTTNAYRKLTGLPEAPKILDIGCGPGMQTLTLAKLSGGLVYALDNHLPFLENIVHSAEKEGLKDKITTCHGSMFELDFDKEFFDIIWSEGAAYIYGIERALLEWKRFLKKGGYFVISDFAWLKDNIPDDLRKFFMDDSGVLLFREDYFKIIKNNGYLLIDHFLLPEKSWWEYYGPLQDRINKLRPKKKNDTEFQAHLDYMQKEIDLYRQYPDYYGYIFFIMINV